MTTLSNTSADAYDRMIKIFELLKQTSSISVISGYLKSKRLAHSAGSWDELLTKRIEPAFADNKISQGELLELLRHAEESGRQHVFLYQAAPDVVANLLDQSAVMQKLAGKNLAHVVAAPLIISEAPNAQIVDVRWEDSHLIVKIVAQRTVMELLPSSGPNADGTISRNYSLVQKRVVHVFRLHPNGTLELRVASHSSSTRYTEEITSLFALVDFLMPMGNFRPFSLLKAKENIWTRREELADRVRVNDSVMKNDDGYAVRGLATSDDGNISTNTATMQSLELFRGEEGYCDSLNLYFLPRGEPAIPAKQVRVSLSGAMNEFAIPARCSHVEFEYIFNEIRAFNA